MMNTMPEHAKKVFDGKIFDIWQWEQKMFDGSIAIFERAKRADAVTIIPVTPDGKIIVTEQLQPHWEKPLLCLPGGVCDSGGTPEEDAARELQEETGYTSSSWMKWKTYASPGKVEWNIYTFIARNCAHTHDLALDAGERITVRTITLEELLDIALEPEFRHHDIQLELVRAKYEISRRKELEKQLFE